MAASGSSGGGTDWISRLNDVSRVEDIDGALTRLLFLPIAAFFVQAANAVEALSNVVISPVNELVDGIVSVISSLLGSGAGTGVSGIIEAGAEATAGDVSFFGIGSFPVALLLVFIGGYIIARYLSLEITSDLIPFSFSDVPFLGVDEDDEGE